METIKTRKSRPFYIILVAFLLFFAFILGFIVRVATEKKEQKIFREVLKLINENSVVVSEVSYEDLVNYGVSGVLGNDDYAKLYTKEEYTTEKSQDKGSYSGFGFSFVGKTNVVRSTVYNSPAEKNGIDGGDTIIKITTNNKETLVEDFDDLYDVVKTLKANDSATFLVKKSLGEEKSITISKENYKAGYVKYVDNERELRVRTNEKGEYFLKEYKENKNVSLSNKTAYIEMTEFSGDLKIQLELALNSAKENGKTELILDLRNNGGGRLDILQEVCSVLLPPSAKKGDLLVNAKLKNDQTNFYLKQNGKNDYIEKTVVLANENTASASEALIGALQHYGGGGFSLNNLVCEYNSNRKDYSTFGKGIMQTTFSLSNGGAIKMTTAKIYWPDKETCIHDLGIVPKSSKNCVTYGETMSRAIEILAS